jgi:hypothetical protein
MFSYLCAVWHLPGRQGCEVMDQFNLKRAKNGVWYGAFPHFSQFNVKHGISTRLGGVSDPPYAQLNLGLNKEDDSAKVMENRRLFLQGLGMPAGLVVTAGQVHGTTIQLVTAANLPEDGHCVFPDTDALITRAVGVPLMLFFADCVPVLIFDPIRRAVAVSHAGWKGTVGAIAAKTVITMQQHFGTNPQDCLVAIGPAIGPCCYEVDEVVICQLQQAFPWWDKVVIPQGRRWLLDLWQANVGQLRDVGVDKANIQVSGICTNCNRDLFYSYRGEQGRTGRMGAAIMLD